MSPLDDKKDTASDDGAVRTYWIQARTGAHWRNLESLADTQAAISRLGVLVSQQAYDELKLVEARLSPITGRTDYTHVVTIEGGEVVETIDAGSPITRDILSKTSASNGSERAADALEGAKSDIAAGAQQSTLDLWRRDDDAPVQREEPARRLQTGLQPLEKSPILRAPQSTDETLSAENNDLGSEFTPELSVTGAREGDAIAAQLRAQLPLFKKRDAPQDLGLMAPPVDREEPQIGPNFLHSSNPEIQEPFLRRENEEHFSHSEQDFTGARSNTEAQGSNPAETSTYPQATGQKASSQQTYDTVRGRFREALIPEKRRDASALHSEANRRRRNGIMGSLAIGAFSAGLVIAAVNPNIATSLFSHLVAGPILGEKRATVAVPAFPTDTNVTVAAQANNTPSLSAASDGRATDVSLEEHTSSVNQITAPIATPIAPTTATPLNEAPASERSLSLAEIAASGNLPALRARLADGADPNARDENGTPILLLAARNGPPSMVNVLLRYGADPVSPFEAGKTVLHIAAASGLTEAVRLMVRSGAPVDAPGGAYGCLTPLGLAASSGWLRTAQVLTEFGATLTPAPGCDIGPMQLAVENPMVLEHFAAVRAQRIAEAQQANPANQAPLGGKNTEQEIQSSELSQAPDTEQSKPQILTAGLLKEDVQSRTGDALNSPNASLKEPLQLSEPDQRSAGIRAPRRPETMVMARANLADAGAGRALLGFTAAEDTIGSGIESAAFSPQESLSAEPVSLEPLLDQATIQNAIQRLIDGGESSDLADLLDRVPNDFDADAMNIKVASNGRIGWRAPVDHAILTGKNAHAAALIANGFKPSDTLLHTIIETPTEPNLRRALGLVLAAGADTSIRRNGETPLMIAAASGDVDFVDALLRAGADPSARSSDGRLVGDFARESQVTAVREQIALAASGASYAPLLFGLSWDDTQQSSTSQIDVCRDVGDGFTACKLSVSPWLDDIAAVVAQFDMEAGGRLVAVQLDSSLFSNELVARQKFEEVVQKIQTKVPDSQLGFPLREIAPETPFFEGLKPSVNASEYYHYWPDQDGLLPAFIQLKMIGHKTREGFFRVIIGNPFRVG